MALESTGVPTVPNNMRLQTAERPSNPSDNRRVRVSNRRTCSETRSGHPGLKSCFSHSHFVMFVCSLTEQRAWLVYTLIVRQRKKLAAIKGPTLAPRPSQCPEPQSPQVSTLHLKPLVSLCLHSFLISSVPRLIRCRVVV